jgi:hypothetical protein
MTRAAEDLDDTSPITLAEASELVLRGKVTVSTLRAEIRRGNLAVERIGKNLFTTPADIREMRKRCRVQPSRPDSISEKTATATSGSSATKTATDELGALKATVQALKNGSLNTLRKSTPRGRPEAASLVPFPSPKS